MPNVTSFVSKGGGKETVVLTLEEMKRCVCSTGNG